MKNLFKDQKLKFILTCLSFLLMNISTIYIIYAIALLSGIENLIRLLVAVILIFIAIICNISYYHSLKKKKSKYIILLIFTIIYSICLIFVSSFIIKTYKTVDSMTSNSTTYSTSLVVLENSKIKDIDSLDNGKIGILADSTSIDGNQLPKEIIKTKKIKNEILEYESYISLINALYEKEVAYAFLPTNYVLMFQNMDGANLENIKDETKVIYTEEKKIKKEIENSSTTLDKPFTVLIMGVDSETEEIANSSFNGDALMLLTFNPETLNTTILSIPRDTYVPIMCFSGHRKNKITHAAWYGEDCMIDTIENYMDITIDYYVKINFKGVVKLVDALGGVEIDVPYAFCEQNSNREFGSNTVFVEKGLQVLNGEQALAFARNRHTWPSICGPKYSNYVSNDFIRGQNQQTVLRSLMNKLKEIKSLNTVNELLNTISKNMETNMTTNEILSLYNIAKDILVKSSGSDMDELIGMQRLYLNGQDSYIYDSGTKLSLYNYVVYKESLAAVTNAMKVNLGLVEPTIIKEFKFSIDEDYEEEVIGRNEYGSTSVVKLPSFIGDTETQAKNSANKLGLTVSFKYVQTGNGTNNTVIDQNYSAGTDVSDIRSLVLTILKQENKKDEDLDNKIDSDLENSDTNEKDDDPDNSINSDVKDDNTSNSTNSGVNTGVDNNTNSDIIEENKPIEENNTQTSEPTTEIDEIINEIN